MSLGTVKIIIAIALVSVGIAAFVSQMLRMGRPGREGDPDKLLRFHKWAGRLFIVLLVPLAFLGAKFWISAGDSLSLRAGFHVVLALTLLVVVLVKYLIARAYRGFLRMAPALGMTIFALMLLVFALSAVFVGLMRVSG